MTPDSPGWGDFRGKDSEEASGETRVESSGERTVGDFRGKDRGAATARGKVGDLGEKVGGPQEE